MRSSQSRLRHAAAAERPRKSLGSRDYRYFYMGLIRRDGTPKLALEQFQRHTPAMGIKQWFHFEDPRLDDAVAWSRRLGVTRPRTSAGRANRHPADRAARSGRAIEAPEFETTATLCFTPESGGLAPHHTSPPKDPMYLADLRARMIERHATAHHRKAVA